MRARTTALSPPPLTQQGKEKGRRPEEPRPHPLTRLQVRPCAGTEKPPGRCGAGLRRRGAAAVANVTAYRRAMGALEAVLAFLPVAVPLVAAVALVVYALLRFTR